MATTTTTQHRPTIDDLLGPSEGRFFSAGYKRTLHDVRDVWFGRDLEPGTSYEERAAHGAKVNGTAKLSYPPNWSTKSSRPLVPHLSTIDALVIAVELAEASLTYRHRLTPAQRRRLWVSRVSMKAGTVPDESLEAVPVSIRALTCRPLVDLHPHAEGSAEYVTRFRAVVGGMKIDLDVEHDGTFVELRPGVTESLDSLLGPSEERYYGRRFTDGDLRLRDLGFEADRTAVTAQVSAEGLADRSRAPHGTSSAYLPALTVLDAMIALPQLAQALLYGLDEVERAASNTLWMRRVEISAPRPLPAPEGPVPARVAFTRTGTVRLDGATWRTAEFSGHLHGMTASASLAHRLPAAFALPRTELVDLRSARHLPPGPRAGQAGSATDEGNAR